jgi:putative membrane protein
MTPSRKILILLFAAVWIWAAIEPLSRYGWLLENALMLVAIPLVIAFGHHFRFSTASYALVTLFLILHVYGSHYTYAFVPFGDTLGAWFGTDRNMFDRLMHLAFGLLFALPIREALRNLQAKGLFWNYWLPLCLVLSFSAAYEVMEWLTVLTVNPEVSVDFVGAQGDIWDAQKDMFLAGIGSFTTLTAILAWNTLLSAATREKLAARFKA